MSRIRLLMSVEGQTEQAFVGAVIAPHLAGLGIDTSARLLFTNRRLGGRGGVIRYLQVRRDLERLFKQHRGDDVRFTTMIDLYGLPDDFPGFSAAQAIADPVARVQCLEASFAADLGDDRFIPFIQLHEFEAVLFCDLTQLVPRVEGSEYGVRALQQEVAGLQPEQINDGEATAPSKRIIRHFPIYERSKPRLGPTAAAAIGLPAIRRRCPHFDEWITHLEQLRSRGCA